MALGRSNLTSTFCRLVGVVALVFWLAENHHLRAFDSYCGDEFCDIDEDCTCSDCEECAPNDDNICDSDWPQRETCQDSPWECEELCVCGNSICEDIVETGGYGSGNDYSPDPEATYCPGDCGGCDNGLCAEFEGQTCDNMTGQCTQCLEYSDSCASGYHCVDGSCVPVPGT